VSGAAFTPVIVESALPSQGPPIAPNREGGTAAIEILIGAATVRVALGIDVEMLTTVLRAVKAAK
jgi:hypothetical protein